MYDAAIGVKTVAIASEYSSGVNVSISCLFLLTSARVSAKFALFSPDARAIGVSIKSGALKPET